MGVDSDFHSPSRSIPYTGALPKEKREFIDTIMKLKPTVLILFIALSVAEHAKAEKPTTIGLQSEIAKPSDTPDEPACDLTSGVDKVEQKEIGSTYSDSRLYDSGRINLNFRLPYPPDSMDFSLIQFYIKQVLPNVSSIDSTKYGIIEIL